MPWVRARLHEQLVFARAKPDGSLLVEGNRVEVCYSPNTSRIYKARPANVVCDEPVQVLPDEACSPKADSAERLKKSPAVARVVSKKPMASATIPKAPKDALIAYADGACSGNPGPAGVGVVVVDGTIRTEVSESIGDATNNIAELLAIERVLDLVGDTTRPLVIHTDSAYAIGVLAKGWKAKANVTLIEHLRERLKKGALITLVHVRGHAGIELNERADELAREAVRTRTSRTSRQS